ncbi:MAG: hypothetical protein KatS3mg087_1178 [Patescibacteria group bacterium]|nr:MAG: hypothetical protein KatS3mg087_1178 [Patescibacteria group bacterium]
MTRNNVVEDWISIQEKLIQDARFALKAVIGKALFDSITDKQAVETFVLQWNDRIKNFSADNDCNNGSQSF